MNNISKMLPSIIIDTLSVKPIRLKESIFLGDNIEIPIILKENNELKKLNEDCKINILYSATIDNITTSIEQKDGFTIDIATSKITIIPKKNALRLGLNKISIQIYDLDESISLSPILLNVQATTDSEIIDNTNDIQSLKDLEDTLLNVGKEVIKLNADIDGVEKRIANTETTIINTIADMESIVDLEIQETRDKLAFEETRIDQAIEEMDKKLNNKNDEIDSIFLKSIQLKPYLNENSKVCFKSDFINIPAKELVKYSFMVHVNTSPYTLQINTACIGILTFTLESNGLVINFNSLLSKTIQGNSTKVSVQFNNNSNVITNLDDFGYKLVFITNGIKDSLKQSRCVLTPISFGII